MTALLTLGVGAVAGGLLGLLLGWLVRGREEVTVEKIVTKTVEKIVEHVPDDVLAQRDQAAMVLAQLEQLAMGVSADISAHSATMGTISDELSQQENADEEGCVVSAIRKLIESNNAMQAKLEDAQSKIQLQAVQLQNEKEQARTDQLTKLRNRRAFDDELNKRAAEFASAGTVVSLMLIDVDHFKKFNDEHGHLAGDEVLRSVGRVLSDRTFGKEGQFPARYGGEEFAVVFAGNTLEAAMQIGDRIRAGIGEEPVQFESKSLRVTASAGSATLQPNETIAAFIARADEALYAAKKAGRNQAHANRNGEFVKVEPKVESVTAKPLVAVDPNQDLARNVQARIAEWKRGGSAISVIVARIDNLAEVEATKTPDELLRVRNIVRDYLQRSLREMDLITNWLGDFYGIMLPTAKLVDAARCAERMRSGIEHGDLTGELGLNVTLSFGAAEVSIEDDGDGLLLRARRAVELARRKGGNVVYIHDGRQSDPAWDRLDLAALSWAETK